MRLIQHFLPRPRQTEIHRIAVKASPKEAWEAARYFDGATIPWVRFLFDLRTLPHRLRGIDVLFTKDSGLGVDDIASHGRGFILLAETPGEEAALGAVRQF